MFFDYTVDIPEVPGKITRKKQHNSTYLECLGMNLEDVQEETKRISRILKSQPLSRMEDEDDDLCGYDPLSF